MMPAFQSNVLPLLTVNVYNSIMSIISKPVATMPDDICKFFCLVPGTYPFLFNSFKGRVDAEIRLIAVIKELYC